MVFSGHLRIRVSIIHLTHLQSYGFIWIAGSQQHIEGSLEDKENIHALNHLFALSF